MAGPLAARLHFEVSLYITHTTHVKDLTRDMPTALNQSEDDIIQIQADAEAAAQLLRAPPVAQTRVNIAPRSQKAPRSKDVMPAQENEASRPRIRT